MWKLNKKMAALVALLPAAYCHYDTQALPRAVDIAGGIVGDGSILFLEKRVFGVSGWANERLCSAKLRMGLAKPHPAAVTPLPAPKADPAPAWLGALAAGRPARPGLLLRHEEPFRAAARPAAAGRPRLAAYAPTGSPLRGAATTRFRPPALAA